MKMNRSASEEETSAIDPTFCGRIVRRSGDNFRRCLHCQSCASGCPVVHARPHRPNGIIRLVQFGYKKEALESPDIWFCMGCHTCAVACPMAIDIAAIMDALRQTAIEEGVEIAEPGILSFHREVVDSIRRYGRTHKLEIMLRYKVRQLDFFSDMDLGLKMLAKRKLDLRPSRIGRPDAVRQLFSEYNERLGR